MLKFTDITRTRDVKRWHSVKVRREQNIAEHQYLVAMLANEMAVRILGCEYSDESYRMLMDYALRHDMPEIMLGDIPLPIKQSIEEYYPGTNFLESMEESICAQFSAAKKRVIDTPLKCIVNLCDLLDAILFIKEEVSDDRSGEIYTATVKVFVAEKELAAERYPQLDWEQAEMMLSAFLEKRTYELTDLTGN